MLLSANSAGYADTTVVGGRTYYYRVTALLNGGPNAGPVAAAAVTTPALAAPTVSSMTLNDGSAQRSTVNTITLVFSGPVTLGPGAIVISGITGDPASVAYTLSPSADGSTYTLTFPALAGGSLADGTYRLTVSGAGVTAADSAAPMAADSTFTFYRLFGDGDGNGKVDFNDFLAMQNAFGATRTATNWNVAYDSDGNGAIDFNDFLMLQNNFGKVTG